MSIKWTGTHSQSDSGILRKSEFKEKKEELCVFGYSCKLFREDSKALHIDQGKHLIPWMGDETLKIDRYDARGALHDLSHHEAPQGGFDWRVELTKSEQEVEQLCDDERYRALHTDEEEELMYKEEELKRLHKAGYGQVGFNYDTPAEPSPIQPAEVDEEPFVPTPAFKDLMPIDTVFPETLKLNAIIEKTSKFIASQGAQMEILIKAKQRDNMQFNFMNKDDPLHPYYTALTTLVKAGKWPEKKLEVVEEKQPETEEYLHPSLAATIIESAPSIPSIHYKPSADCDYTMLISKMRGDGDLAPGELPPPGTEFVTAPAPGNVIARAPILYNTIAPPTAVHLYQQQQYAMYYQQYMAALVPPQPLQPPQPPQPPHSTGLSLMKNYDSGDESNLSESEEEPKTNGGTSVPSTPIPTPTPTPTPTPPEDVRLVIEKMAAYVARNGDEFADIVRAKNDPRFTFLEPTNAYHAYYSRLMQEKRGADDDGDADKTNKAPVSFSIKKLKEPDPILPKPALPYESSSDDDEHKAEKSEKPAEKPYEKPAITEEQINNAFPPILVYKMDGQLTHNLPKVKAIEPLKYLTKTVVQEQHIPIQNIEITKLPEIKKVEAIEYNPEKVEPKNYDVQNYQKIDFIDTVVDKAPPIETEPKQPSPLRVRHVDKFRMSERDNPTQRREKKRRKDYRSKSEIEYKRAKSSEREKRRERERERERDKKRRKVEEVQTEIILLEDNSDDTIDLTGDLSDTKGDADTETDKTKQLERRRRATEFLKKVGVDPGAVVLPTNSLASAMVDTLESIRKKKAADEEKRRRKEKRRRRERRDYNDEAEKSHRKSKRRKNRSSDDEESSNDAHKKKKRRKDKKTSKAKKKRRHEPSPLEEEDRPTPPNINLSSTLKELRTNSPTKNLIIPDVDTFVDSDASEDLQSEELKSDEMKERKEEGTRKREYSEGEWSSDSEEDSFTDESKRE